MICKNCGAKIDDEILLCPFCQTENETVARKEQEDYINGIYEKKKNLKNVPQKVANKVTKYLLYGVAGILVVAFLVVMVVSAFSKVTQSSNLAVQDKELEKLEGYYQAGEYEKMGEYLDKINKRGGSYEKYIRIAELYESMEWHLECMQLDMQFTKSSGYVGDSEQIETELLWYLEALSTIAQMEELDFPYGEEEGALYIKERYVNGMMNYLLLSEAEIENAVITYGEGNRDYMELSEIVIERLEELVSEM